MSKEKAHSAVARPFVNWYESLPWDQRGLIEDAMRDVLRAVEDNVQPGSMTLVIKIQPKGKRKVVLSPSVSTKLPRPKLEASSAWITPVGDLSQSDPQQPDLPMISVSSPERPLTVVKPT